MAVDTWAGFAQIGTFVVIAATAAAALVQLRHLRAANNMAAASTFMQEFEGSELRDAFTFVRTQLKQRLEDPMFREEIRDFTQDRSHHPEIAVCNFFDLWGGHYREGAVNRSWFMRHNAGVVLGFWALLEPVVALAASRDGTNLSFEQFEYLAVKAQDWVAAHPAGDYPKGVRRLTLADPWSDIDRTPKT